MIRSCIDCKHFSTDATFLSSAQGTRNEPRCYHPDAATRDLVDGLCYCRNERAVAGKRGCGKAGRLWTSRKTSTPA